MSKENSIQRINDMRTREALNRADGNGIDCLAAAIVGVGATRSDRVVPSIDTIKKDFPVDETTGMVKPRELLSALNVGARVINMPISRVLISREASEFLTIPEELREKLVLVEGREDVITPAVLIMVGRGNNHAEACTNWPCDRVDRQLSEGRRVGMAVEFEKR